jgi:adenine-specific DNA-methyltransferase
MSEDTRLPLATPDPAADLLAQLRAAAPQAFSEGRLDLEKLRAALGESIETGPERYGLTWAGKSDAFRNVQTPSVGTLLPMPEESVDWDNAENLIIEGDNLEVLKLLQRSYYGKVKMIYIDPPYNTGNDFIYEDDYREPEQAYLRQTGQIDDAGIRATTKRETTGRYHSNWLSMVYPRLFLARNLLREDGVIFASIDDNELHNLRAVMNEVFGEENFVGCFVWKRRASSALAERLVSTDHEYVVAYQRQDFTSLGIPKDFGSYSNPDNDPRGDWTTGDLTVGMNKNLRPNQFYDLVDPETGTAYPANPNRVWAYIPETMNMLLKEKRVIFPAALGRKPMLKRFKNELKSNVNPVSTWLSEVGLNSEATRQIQELMGSSVFSYPKPASLIEELVSTSVKTSDIVMDFFAGSGTTAQVILDLNNADGGNRKFILVQLPEKTDDAVYPTVAHITRERVRRVIAKLNKEKDGKLNFKGHKPGNGFRAFKLSSSNFKIWNSEKMPNDPAKLAEQLKLYADNLEGKRKQQDILYELVLKSGLPLSSKVEKISIANKLVWSINEGKLLISLENKVSRETLRSMLALKPQQMLCLDAAFDGDDALKTNTVLEAKSQGVAFHTV